MERSHRQPSPRLTNLLLLVGLIVTAPGCASSASTPNTIPDTSPLVSSTLATPSSTSPALPTPSPRGYHLAVSLGDQRGVVLFGGSTAPPPAGAFLADTWAFQGRQQWESLEPIGQPAFGDAAAFDSKSNRLVAFTIVQPGTGETSEDHSWVFDPVRNLWEEYGSIERPVGLHGSRAAYDTESDMVILVTNDGETWAYDLDGDAWNRVTPAVSPPTRDFFAMTYHEAADQVIIFGGYPDRSDTWAYDYNTDTWLELSLSPRPAGRSYPAMTYVPTTGQIVLFGGVRGSSETPLGDTWIFDLGANTWTEVTPDVAPSPRGWHAIAYDYGTGNVVLFGGGANRDEYLQDTWLFDPITMVWSQLDR